MEVILLKCGELVLKGLNRRRFEDRLMQTVRRNLKPLGKYKVSSSQSMIYVEPEADAPVDEAFKICEKVFGITAIQRAAVCEKDMESILRLSGDYLSETLAKPTTFKVQARRSDKQFPLTSPQISAEVGGYLHELFPHITPKMDDPEVTVTVEIREKHAYISGEKLPGAGGMPNGSAGRGMLLLSGGIDSPVAGYMMAKRGMDLCAVHFHSPPYTSQQAKEKVLSLAEKLSVYSGRIAVFVVPFTKVQTEIRDKCDENFSTILMRRLMMRVAQIIADRQECKALVTGESLGQVASQTLESIVVTDSVCDMPVFRPLIGMDKEEIVTISRKIDAYDTSILPYEDCCTIFTPKHPQTKPRIDRVEDQESRLDVETLLAEALENIEKIVI